MDQRPSHPLGGVSGLAIPCGKGHGGPRRGSSQYFVGDAGAPDGQPAGRGVRKHTWPRTRARSSDWWVAPVTA